MQSDTNHTGKDISDDSDLLSLKDCLSQVADGLKANRSLTVRLNSQCQASQGVSSRIFNKEDLGDDQWPMEETRDKFQ